MHSSFVIVHAQSTTATLSGIVTDQNNALVSGVNIAVINKGQGFQRTTTTNDDGTFVVPQLPPSSYIVKAEREGFNTAEIRDVVLNVNDEKVIKISLSVGKITQTVLVSDSGGLIDQSPAVGTVVDNQFVNNLPLNGRSFNQLITLTPGVVLTKATASEGGQFSVNGQRANANYFSVDGVSATFSITAGFGNGQTIGGSLPALSAAGGTNNLVSVDALQEFKVLTSTFAPEFGRTPGAQVQIVTRSGSNDFHSTFFEYFRNDVLDANDWFVNRSGGKRAPLRQNDFGFVLGGPVLLPRFGEGGSQPGYNGRNKTFFFFSYEGLRLRQPLFLATEVPSLPARQNANARMQPFLNAFPRPTGPTQANGFAQFASAFSNPSTLNATNIRIDHTVSNHVTLFGRYDYAPSFNATRGGLGASLNTVSTTEQNTQTLTLGSTQVITSEIVNDFRANYTRYIGKSTSQLDTFGQAIVPSDSAVFPFFGSPEDSLFVFSVAGGANSSFFFGSSAANVQRQANIVDGLSVIRSSHQLKFGVDYRRLFPIINLPAYRQVASFINVAQAAAGTLAGGSVSAFQHGLRPVYTNLSFYGQDSWKMSHRFMLTYGLRYEINPPPTEQSGNEQFAVTGLDNPATIALAPRGTKIYETTFNNFAPRVGASYQLSDRPGRELILRGGFGVFYDLGNTTAGTAFGSGNFPFAALRSVPANTSFPLTSDLAKPPAFSLTPSANATISAFDPHLKLPYTYQWNVAMEQSLGSAQSLTLSYVGAQGRRLLRLESLINPNPTLANGLVVQVTRNSATSDYRGLQLQFQRRLSRGLQSLVSYTWSKSEDTASNDSSSNTPAARLDPELDRGPSNFDVRHAFSAAVTYNLPMIQTGRIGKAITRNWGVDTIFTARSATPVNVTYNRNFGFGTFGFRPDVVPDVPLYIFDPSLPGGKKINSTVVPGSPNQRGPFVIPTETRQGNLKRNTLRGFPVHQIDVAVRRQFRLTERLNLQFRAEAFNLFNHPNFGDPTTLSIGTVSAT
ncbi:MAG TPA: TonB-dependent receptor, partial [Pyrinomonadaceae bacterium]|nr:TonB-dependent receptor [Pyrinomonadaceae bacterium]